MLWLAPLRSAMQVTGWVWSPPQSWASIFTARNSVHSKKNWSAQLGNLLVHSELTSLVHYLEMHFCAQGCAPLGHFKSLGKRVHKRCTTSGNLHLRHTNLCTSCALKCPRTWSVQVVHNLAHKRAFPSSAHGLLTLSARASSQVARSSSFRCENTVIYIYYVYICVLHM